MSIRRSRSIAIEPDGGDISKSINAGHLWASSPGMLIVTRVACSTLSFASAPLMARGLGVDGRGQVAACLSAFYLLGISVAIGIPNAVQRRTAISDPASFVRSARLLILAAVIPCTVGVYLVLGLMPHFPDRIAVSLGIGISPIVGWSNLHQSVLLVRQKFGAILVQQLADQALFVAAIAALAIAGDLTVGRVMLVNMGSYFVGATLATTSAGIPLRGPATAITEVVKYSSKFAGGAISEIAGKQLDQILVLPVIGSYQSGLYAVAMSLGMWPLILGQSIGAVFVRLRALSETDDDARSTSAAAVREGLSLSLVAALGLAVLATPIVRILYGEPFIGSLPSVMVWLCGTVAMGPLCVASMVLVGAGDGWAMTKVQLVSIITGAGLLFAIGPLWGALGAAAASSVAYWAALILACRYLHLGIRDLLPLPHDFSSALTRLVRRS
jgi:O-antigen/teichoic acid export membrane protein